MNRVRQCVVSVRNSVRLVGYTSRNGPGNAQHYPSACVFEDTTFDHGRIENILLIHTWMPPNADGK
jgi:hypothetical protein